jgi:hypothetical protein
MEITETALQEAQSRLAERYAFLRSAKLDLEGAIQHNSNIVQKAGEYERYRSEVDGLERMLLLLLGFDKASEIKSAARRSIGG